MGLVTFLHVSGVGNRVGHLLVLTGLLGSRVVSIRLLLHVAIKYVANVPG